MNAKFLSKLFKAAHKLAREIRNAGDDYKATFALCLGYVRRQAETVAEVLNASAEFAHPEMNPLVARAWSAQNGRIQRVYVKGAGRNGRDYGYIDCCDRAGGTLSWYAANIAKPILERLGIRVGV